MSDEYKKFMETLNSPGSWESLDSQSFFHFTYDAIYTYGYTNNLELIPLIRRLYIYFRKRTETEERWNLYQDIVREVSNNNISVFAFLPFLYEENDKAIVSTAAIDYCAYRPLENDDPLTAVKEIIPRIIQQTNVECRYGLFGGLLCLGDRRVNNMLWQIKQRLLPDEVKSLVTIQTGILYTNTFEFYMHWLEELKEDSGNEIFGSVASGIVCALRQAQKLQKTDEPTVIDHERVFPSPEDVNPSNLKKEYKFSEYRNLIAPRLLAITDKETGERVMSFALKAWGIPFENKMAPQKIIVDKSFWLQKDGEVHMTWHIFNPNGPTLNCIGSFHTEDEYIDNIKVHRNITFITPNKGIIKKTFGHLTLLITANTFDFIFFRAVASYSAFSITLIAAIIYFMRYGIPIKTMVVSNIAYLLAAIYQSFFPYYH